MLNYLTLFFLALMLIFPLAVFSETPHLISLAENSEPGSGSLSRLGWLIGHWQGEALGGVCQEVWSPPLGDSMVGAFKLVKNDSTVFYELMTIIEANESLILKLKHFNSDLTGWEEKDEAASYPLVEMKTESVYFSGLTMEKVSADSLNVYVGMRQKDGRLSELIFRYHRLD